MIKWDNKTKSLELKNLGSVTLKVSAGEKIRAGEMVRIVSNENLDKIVIKAKRNIKNINNSEPKQLER